MGLTSFAIFQLHFWVGGEFYGGDIHWFDGTKTNSSVDDFPLWGKYQPNIENEYPHLLLSNSPEYTTMSSSGSRRLVWTNRLHSFKAGFICERPGDLILKCTLLYIICVLPQNCLMASLEILFKMNGCICGIIFFTLGLTGSLLWW